MIFVTLLIRNCKYIGFWNILQSHPQGSNPQDTAGYLRIVQPLGRFTPPKEANLKPVWGGGGPQNDATFQGFSDSSGSTFLYLSFFVQSSPQQ